MTQKPLPVFAVYKVETNRLVTIAGFPTAAEVYVYLRTEDNFAPGNDENSEFDFGTMKVTVRRLTGPLVEVVKWKELAP